MEKTQPEKTASFSRKQEEKPIESDHPSDSINEEEQLTDEKKETDEKEREEDEEPKEINFKTDYQKMSEEIDQFLHTVSSSTENNKDDPDQDSLLEVPESVEKFTMMVQGEIAKYDLGKDFGRWSRETDDDDSSSILEAVEKISKLMDALSKFPSEPNYVLAVHRTSSVLHRAMLFLEEEFRSLLEDSSSGGDAGPGDLKTRQMSISSNQQEPDRSTPREPGSAGADANFPGFAEETISRLTMIVKTMIAVGYETECCLAFAILRRSAFDDSLSKIGCEKISIEDVLKMQWEPLEGEIVTWIKTCKRCMEIYLPGERKFSESIFADHPSISATLYSNLAYGVVNQLLNFAEAVTMTKRSAEKLFKFLDMYETLRDLINALDSGDLFPDGSSSVPELKSEAFSALCRLGVSAVSIFSDLENSIKADNGKTPVPGGAVHPLTRYVMNYVKYTCEYKETLEQVFQEHQKLEKPDDDSLTEDMDDSTSAQVNSREESPHPSPFSVQLMAVMDLLDSNLDAKSKLYKDLSLSYIFLMNNGRYIMQKIKGSAEIHELLGPTWCRKRSSDLRQYHKNYQRETWGKVLGCLRDEGLHQGKGGIVKPALKERFKAFNAMFEEILKTQSMWVVSDVQLQSELRVSISAVVIPAYRSFLGRFQQYLDPGRQTEKYIKYWPEELETFVDELFDGKPASMVRRR